MASSTSRSVPEEDYSCPVCRDVFKDPVLLSCSHSFCKACVQEWWRNKNTEECPLCKEIHSTTGHPPPRNLALRNLCEAFVQERELRRASAPKRKWTSEDLCDVHAEKHKLFCLDCLQPVCVVCLHSEMHASHRFKPIDEAALEHKKAVLTSLTALRERMRVFNEAKTKSDQTATHFKAQIQRTERQIKEQFKKLHQFLQREEAASIAALREEERQKSQVMKETILVLYRDISILANGITAVEEELRAEHVPFLQNYETTMERLQLTVPDPQPVSGPLIDVAKHLGNLAFRVWDKMRGDVVSCSPVVLDPNTAHPRYALSDDLSSARWGERQRLPNSNSPFNSEFDHLPFVLASEGFDSGTHSWDVEVGDSASWVLGAAQRRGDRQGSHWGIRLFKGTYSSRFLPGPDHQVSARCCNLAVIDLLEQKPHRIRVQLDWNERKLSFSDPDTDTHIYTFKDRHAFTRTEALFPFIATGHVPLKILPGKISVTVEQCS